MEFRCKLSAVNDIIFKLWYEIKEPLRSYEVHPTEESLGWGRSSVCEYDYTVHIPTLKLFFRDATEFEFDEEEQKEMPIETILHCYREGETEPCGSDYCSVRDYVLWYIKDQGISIENPDDLECVFDLPYDIDRKELEI